MPRVTSMHRSIIIAASLIVLLGLSVAAYFYFFSSAPSTTAPITTSGLPVAGPGSAPTGSSEQVPPSSAPGAPVPVGARLVKISAGPVVPGEVIVTKTGTASTSPESVVSYIERQSGNVFTYSSFTKTTTRVSNKTLPGIQSASWLPDASVAFVRYLSGADFSTINTYALPINGSAGFFLPQNLSDIGVSSTGLLTLVSGVNGSVVSLLRTDGSRSSSVFTTPLSSIRIAFAGKQYLAYTKPSSRLPGNAFLIDGAGHPSRIAGPLDGLAALASPSGKWLLVSYISGDAMQLEVVNVSTNESIALPIATIVDKCVWAQNDSSIYCGVPVDPPTDAAYPDDWYQGAVHFSDRIWRIDVSSRYAQLVLDFSAETKISLDAEALSIDPSSLILAFVNRNDGSLWSYAL